LVDCNAQASSTSSFSIANIWKGIDSFIVESDKLFCTSGCPCNLSNTTDFIKNYPLLYAGYKIDTINGVKNFTTCPEGATMKAYENAVASDPTLDYNQTFTAPGFGKMFAWIENTFQCTGWCAKEYPVTTSVNGVSVTTTVPLVKYLYSDINK
jgi:hypothetical protein